VTILNQAELIPEARGLVARNGRGVVVRIQCGDLALVDIDRPLRRVWPVRGDRR